MKRTGSHFVLLLLMVLAGCGSGNSQEVATTGTAIMQPAPTTTEYTSTTDVPYIQPTTTTTTTIAPTTTAPPEPVQSTSSGKPQVLSKQVSGSVWDRLAECETGGEWDYGPHSNWGSRIYEGGLQFHPDTWTGFGGTAYAPRAYQASREQQIAIAEKVLASQGWGAWPKCSSELGLR